MPLFASLSAVQTALLSQTTTVRALVQHYLQRAEATKQLNAYIEIWAAEALAQADVLDERLRSTPFDHVEHAQLALGKLFGAVVSIKDNICYADHQVTAGSKILEGFTSLYSATAVERIVAAGAIIIGRTNCDQFGMGSSNENSVYGPVLHPIDPTRVPGGSSGGAAVSVQTDTCLVALGSDTGGSVRQPAAFCGIWGFKPTYGRISRHGLLAYGSSFDQIGFLAHAPEDIAAFLNITAGADDFDSTALDTPIAPIDLNALENAPVRIAYFTETIDSDRIEAGVRTVTTSSIEQLRAAGHIIEGVSFKKDGAQKGVDIGLCIPAYYVLTTAEASSNLARYDGLRYGYRSPQARNLEETYLLSRSEGFSDEVKRRILLGTFVLSSGYYDAYYSKAQRVRRLLQARIFDVLSQYDCILLPAAPSVAWRFGEKSKDPVAMYLSDIYTVLANLAGVPALSFPAGTHPDNGMPIGVQLMGKMGEEGALLKIGHIAAAAMR